LSATARSTATPPENARATLNHLEEEPGRDSRRAPGNGLQMHGNTYAPSSDSARAHAQLDLFARTPASLASTSVLGLTILTEPCPHCGGAAALVGSSCAMHHARATCCGCGRHSRWLSHQDFQRLTEIVDALGHPTSPIDLGHSLTGLSTYVPGVRP
jgi:hypothetical protein